MGQPDGDFSAIDVVAMLFFGVLNYDAKQEGSNWEAAMSAGHLRLENLTLIVHPNRLPALLALLTASPKGRGKPLCTSPKPPRVNPCPSWKTRRPGTMPTNTPLQCKS